MALFPEEDLHRGSASRLPVLVVASLLVVAAGGAFWWLTRGSRSVEPAPRPATDAPSAVAEPRPTPTTPRPERRPEPAAPPLSERAATETGPASPASAPAARGVLRVTSDVAGASVFLDRTFLGTTPLDKTGLSPGSHRINVSAEGYEGVAQTIEIGDEPAEVAVRFKDVRLDASIPVVHKHGVGSCEGRLAATVEGLRYETTNRGDAFSVPFSRVQGFDVDYLQKNLRVRIAGGKTYNFTDPAGSADALFVFHRDVEKARARLR